MKMMRNLSESDILELHAQLGDETLPECEQARSIGYITCFTSCCREGAPLFPGESYFFLEKQKDGFVPEDIRIMRGSISNCLDEEKGCRLTQAGTHKPLICATYPVGTYYEHIDEGNPEWTCNTFGVDGNGLFCPAANKNRDFDRRAREVLLRIFTICNIKT